MGRFFFITIGVIQIAWASGLQAQNLNARVKTLEEIISVQQAEIAELRELVAQVKFVNGGGADPSQPGGGGSTNNNKSDEETCRELYISSLDQIKCRRCIKDHNANSDSFSDCMN